MGDHKLAAGLAKGGARALESTRCFCRDKLWAGTRRCSMASYSLVRNRLVPAIGRGQSAIRGELVKIHREQNWFLRCRSTFAGNAAGLGMAMLSTKVVESIVETREASNLWGILADRPVVSATTFEVLSFFVELGLGLIVFTVTEYYVAEYQRKRSITQSVSPTGDDGTS